MKKRFFSALSVLIFVLSFLPMPVMATSSQEENVIYEITKYISDNNKSFKSGYKGKAWGCFAFCNYVWKGVFGVDYYDEEFTRVYSSGPSSDIYGFLSNNNAKAGDILWCHTSSNSITHNMIILAYDSTGIWLSDGTSAGVLWHNNTKISYDDPVYKDDKGYFDGKCYLTLYKISDSYWNSTASKGSSSTKMYTINYDANGGTIAQTYKSVAAGSACGTLPTPIRDGYIFEGWYTSSASGTKVTSTTKINGNMTLYAHWSEIRASVNAGKWDVVIPLNYKLLCYSSSTAAKSSAYISAKSSSYTIRCTQQAVFSNGKTRYFFVSADNKQLWFDFTNAMKLESEMTSEPKAYTVYFDPNGGTSYTVSKTVTNSSTYGTLPTPTRNGYAFDGWYTAQSGGNQILASTNVNLTADQTLYAHWSQSSSHVTRTSQLDLSSMETTNNPSEGWSWNRETKTLVLDNVNIIVADEPSAIRISSSPSTTIILKGTNTVTSTYYNTKTGVSNVISAGILVRSGSLVIDGDGSLTATGGTSPGSSYGVYILERNLTINGGSVTCIGGTSVVYDSIGICSYGLTVNAGSLTAKGGNGKSGAQGIVIYSGDLNVNDGVLRASVGNATKPNNYVPNAGLYSLRGKLNLGTGVDIVLPSNGKFVGYDSSGEVKTIVDATGTAAREFVIQKQG